MKRPILAFLAGALISIILGFLSSMTFEDAVEEQERYCAMVAEKTWPDYKSLKQKCPGGN